MGAYKHAALGTRGKLVMPAVRRIRELPRGTTPLVGSWRLCTITVIQSAGQGKPGARDPDWGFSYLRLHPHEIHHGTSAGRRWHNGGHEIALKLLGVGLEGIDKVHLRTRRAMPVF